MGLISDNWGGTCLQSWAGPAVGAACGLAGQADLYNAMIMPYLVGPTALTAFLWSQGACGRVFSAP